MKITDENYDMTGFKLTRFARLLLVLRFSQYGAWEMRANWSDVAKLFLQHRLGSKVDGIKRRLSGLKARLRR